MRMGGKKGGRAQSSEEERGGRLGKEEEERKEKPCWKENRCERKGKAHTGKTKE